MITKVRELINTEDSHFFTSAVKRCRMDDYSYVEKEYLFSGTANIYETGADGKPSVKYHDCVYTNRMMIRRPENREGFSGRVVVEIVNSTANFDIDRVWAESYRYLMRNGDIFIGITSKPNVFTALKRFDEKRYEELDWPNPSDEPVPQNDTPPIWTGPQDQETGYIWDILKEIPTFLKNKDEKNPLAGWDVKYVYLCGWSQSCSYMTQFITSFENQECHAYDGYLASGGVRSFATPLNRYESVRAVDSYQKRLNQAPAPVIELNTESEAGDEWGFTGYSARRNDNDDPLFRYRYMDIAGGCHDSVDTCMAYNAYDDDIKTAMGLAESVPGNSPVCMNDYPKYFAFHVAWRNLYLWCEQGIAPKRYERMAQTADGRILKDAFGNSIGGLRTPMVDYPVCTYYNWSEEIHPVTGEKRMNVLAGHEEDFSKEFLQELYHNAEHYQELVQKDTERLVADGQILPEDAAVLVEFAVARAAKAGLR